MVDFLGVSTIGLGLAWLSSKALTFACVIVLCGDCNGVSNAVSVDPVAVPKVLVGVTDSGGGTELTVLVFRIVEDGLFGLPGTKFGTAATCEAVPADVVVVAACVTFIGD